MCFKPVDVCLHQVAHAWRVEESRPAVTGLDAIRKVGEHHQVVVLQVTIQWLDGRSFASALVFTERHKHPAHRRRTIPSAIVNILARMDDLLRAR